MKALGDYAFREEVDELVLLQSASIVTKPETVNALLGFANTLRDIRSLPETGRV